MGLPKLSLWNMLTPFLKQCKCNGKVFATSLYLSQKLNHSPTALYSFIDSWGVWHSTQITWESNTGKLQVFTTHVEKAAVWILFWYGKMNLANLTIMYFAVCTNTFENKTTESSTSVYNADLESCRSNTFVHFHSTKRCVYCNPGFESIWYLFRKWACHLFAFAKSILESGFSQNSLYWTWQSYLF